jgi:methylated-DNA-[protein]-cysteine S-methyltransferase
MNMKITIPDGTVFQQSVWRELVKIPKGKTVTYKELARRVGKPRAIRAVANAVGANKMLVTIPCHRVIHSDGTIGGYSGRGGVKAKLALLKKEGVKTFS